MHILCSNIETQIARDFEISKAVKNIHSQGIVNTLFIHEPTKYSLLREYCDENEIERIEIYPIPHINNDIISSYFGIIFEYSEKNKSKENLVFVSPFLHFDTKRLEYLLKISNFEVESLTLGKKESCLSPIISL